MKSSKCYWVKVIKGLDLNVIKHLALLENYTDV
jgi:hypothetical protein